jgi:hypothetical protein
MATEKLKVLQTKWRLKSCATMNSGSQANLTETLVFCLFLDFLTYKGIFHVNPRVQDMILAFIVDITAFKASSLHITDPHYIYLHGRKKPILFQISIV